MSFDSSRFLHPPAELRGAPFFSLNHDLTNHARLRDYLDAFAEMGIGGVHLHVRSGLKTPYLGPDFLEAVSAVREYASQKGMLSYLYDEDTWPSGFAGGAVTREPRFRQRWVELRKGRPGKAESDFRRPLCAYHIELNQQGALLGYERVPFDQAGEGDWYLTRCIAPDSDRFNGAAYLDVLNSEAVQAFIDSTHEVYLGHFGGSFPADVPAIFTDEPQLAAGRCLQTPFDGEAELAWTEDLPESFANRFDADLLEVLPRVIWLDPEGPSPWRWRFWDHLGERFATAFADGLGRWCGTHGIALTGHMMCEDTLVGQVARTGETMRHYRGFQIPGIDVLCDEYLPQTAKQAVSVARQDGRSGVMSELYGVTNWDFPFSGHKRQGDWQAALGVTLRVHHLSWLSMEGQSKRDYPASIGPQSPWYREYPVIEDHFARVGAALTSGRPLVRIGVIHPVESLWMRWGVNSVDDPHGARLEAAHRERVNALLDHGLDFDFIAESLLPGQERETHEAELRVGEMSYRVVVVPELETLRKSTLERLRAFRARGGELLVQGGIPPRCDGVPGTTSADMLADARVIGADMLSLVQALEPWREIAVLNADLSPAKEVNHQVRQCGRERILFCANRKREAGDTHPWRRADPRGGRIRIRGLWTVTELNTADGSETSCAFRQRNGWTEVPWDLHPQSHRLLRLAPGTGGLDRPPVEWTVLGDCPEPRKVTPEEPNVLLLDQAEWRLDDGGWRAKEDSLLVQRGLAERFGWPDWGQPYTVKDAGPPRRVGRRFEIHCQAEISSSKLVCERLSAATVLLDGQPLSAVPDGWWVDRDLPTMPLPPLGAGTHRLEVTLDLDAVDRHLEWCYLLGDFGVETRGAHARLVPGRETIRWGDVVPQGLPFYGGNLDYETGITLEEAGSYALRCPNVGGALVRVFCDGRDCGPVYTPPWRVALGDLSAGAHRLRIRVYGNRYNSFGPLHNNRPDWQWWGPDSWYGRPEERNAVWNLGPAGLLRAPLLEKQT